ncbi:helix-turn-helix domain-containing protein [Vagococcus salmoninarum]
MAQFIYERKNKELSLKELASELEISSKMLTESIYEYQTLNLEQCGLLINIIDKQVVTYQINNFSFNKMKQVLIKRSLNFKLCQKIFTGEFTNVLDFSEEHYISIASMYRHVKDLKKIFKKYRLTLNLSQEPMIKGQEYHIRHFYFELFFGAYGLTEDYLEQSPWQVDSQEESLLDTAFPIRQKIRLLYYISFSRLSQNYYTSEMTFLKPYKAFMLEEKFMGFYANQLRKIGASEKQMTKELNFLLIYTLKIGLFDNKKLAQIDLHASENSQERNEKISWVHHWVELFSDFFAVKLSLELHLLLSANLYIYFISKEFFPYSVVDFNDVLLKYQKDNPYIWDKTLLFKNQLKQQYPQIIISDYLTHYYIREIVSLSREELEVCVFSSCSHSQNRIIEREIKKRALVQIIITRKITEKTRLIVSDLDFDVASINSTNKPERVFIQTIPSESDYQLITKKILKLSQ